VLRHVRDLTVVPETLGPPHRVQVDRALRVVLPAIEAERRAVEIAVYRAVLELSAPGRKNWWSRWFEKKT